MVSIRKLVIFITLSYAFRRIGVGQSTGRTFKADISTASLTIVPFGVDVKIFPTSNTVKCHFFIVVNKFCPDNWMVWLTYKRCINLSDFLLQLLIEHVWCDSTLDTDLNVLDNLIVGQIRASITGEMQLSIVFLLVTQTTLPRSCWDFVDTGHHQQLSVLPFDWILW